MAAPEVHTVIVTGANRGLGRYVATTLATRNGYRVVLTARKLESLTKVAADIAARDGAQSRTELGGPHNGSEPAAGNELASRMTQRCPLALHTCSAPHFPFPASQAPR